ncbi:MAG: hypothetical protein Q4B26_06280 [Eubacteriales bacterium]|nr:hypothetical protein [Eubacteriales bacterium]
MGNYILCQTRRASVPFYIESISTNIYSIEELCYFLSGNLYLIDRTLINNSLCNWIENELWLPALAAKIRLHLGKFSDLSDVLYPIFKEINYLSYEEMKKLNELLNRMDRQKPEVRRKEKADCLMDNQMYVQAIREYQELLKDTDPEKTKENHQMIFRAGVYHNLACAYANLFQMEKAQECFYQAYLSSGDDKELVDHLLALRTIRSEEDFAVHLEKILPGEAAGQKLKDRLEFIQRLPEPETMGLSEDELIREITRAYHRSTGS